MGDNFGGVLYSESYFDGLFVGSLGNDVDGNSGEGSVYYYRLESNTLIFDEQITSPDGQPFDRFGSAMAYYSFFDSVLFIGAPVADIGTANNQGAVYAFIREGQTGNYNFRFAGKFTARDGAGDDSFGAQIESTGTNGLIVSSPNDDVDADADQGSVSILRRSAVTSSFNGFPISDTALTGRRTAFGFRWDMTEAKTSCSSEPRPTGWLRRITRGRSDRFRGIPFDPGGLVYI